MNTAYLALADQITANGKHTVHETVTAMKELIDHHPDEIEIKLTEVISGLAKLCDNSSTQRATLIAAYVMAIYELARK